MPSKDNPTPAPTPAPPPLPIMPAQDMKSRIKQSITNHENRIKELKGLQEALDKNPELEKLLTIYQQGVW